MPASHTDRSVDPSPSSAGLMVVRQVADCLRDVLELIVVVADDGSNCVAEPEPGQPGGVRGAQATLDAELGAVRIQLQLCSDGRAVRAEVLELHARIKELGSECAPVDPPAGESPHSVWWELGVRATPLGPARLEVLQQRLRRVEATADWLHAQRPQVLDSAGLRQQYAPFSEALAPVLPGLGRASEEPWASWVADTLSLLEAGASVAVEAPAQALLQAGLALLAAEAAARGRSVGRLTTPSINVANLLKLAQKAPGWLAVPAVQLSVGGHAYELSSEIQGLLSNLGHAGRGLLFVGSQEELEGVFHGGQGARRDPLAPAVRHCPRLPLDRLVPFALTRAAEAFDAPLVAAQHSRLAGELCAALAPLSAGQQLEQIDLLARGAMRSEQAGRAQAGQAAALVELLGRHQETLGGLRSGPGAARWPWFQERLEREFADMHALDVLQAELVGQESALTELVRRLQAEAYTQPLHQPPVWLAEGTVGTGKSASAEKLAALLELPLVRVNGAGFAGIHTAVAQLLGSGRGIVGSQHAGRLEQAAKTGALLEVSDLDHATPSVRSYLGDLFLELLESGQAVSSWGRPFCCSNLVICFSINLPAGGDERIGRSLGFGAAPDRREQRARVAEHVRQLVSSAFLSRVGQPIVFEPLSPASLAHIAERQLRRAVQTATQRAGFGDVSVALEPGVGRCMVNGLGRGLASYGARGLDGRARQAVAAGLLPLLQGRPRGQKLTLRITAGAGGWPHFEDERSAPEASAAPTPDGPPVARPQSAGGRP